MGKKRTRTEDETTEVALPGRQYDDNGEEIFAVEVITKVRVVEDESGFPSWEYLVQWGGYDRDHDSWEPAEALNESCERLCRSLWKELDINGDQKDYPVGTVLKPSAAWIAREKKYYHDELKKEAERLERRNRKRQKVSQDEGQKEKEKTKAAKEKGKAKNQDTEKSKPKEKEKTKEKSKPKAALKVKEPSVPKERPKSRASTTSIKAHDTSDSEDDKPLMTKAKAVKSSAEPKKMPPTLEDSSDDDVPIVSKLPQQRKQPPSNTQYKSAALKRKERQTQETATLVTEENGDTLFTPPPPDPQMFERQAPERPRVTIPTEKSLPSAPSSAQPVTSAKPSSRPGSTNVTPVPSSATTQFVQSASPSAHLVPAHQTPLMADTGLFTENKKKVRSVKIIQDPNLTIEGNATKQRIAHQLSAADAESRGPSQGTTVPPTKKLVKLPSFKKNKPIEPATSPTNTVPSSPSSKPQDPRPRTFNPRPLPTPLRVSLPATPPVDEVRGGREVRGPTLPIDEDEPASSTVPDLSQADEFLRNQLPAEMAAPMDPENLPDDLHDIRGPVRLVDQVAKAAQTQIQKKFCWTGTVELRVQDVKETEKLCEISINDTVQLVVPGLQFQDVVMGSDEGMVIESLHDVSDLPDLLLACAPVTSLARVGPSEEKDKQPFESFVRYLLQKRQIALIPMRLHVDALILGHILFFPHNLLDLATRFQVPSNLWRSDSIVAALLRWKQPISIHNLDFRPNPAQLLPSYIDHPQFLKDTAHWNNTVISRPHYQVALRILGFPEDLHRFLEPKDPPDTRTGKRAPGISTYVWYDGGDGRKDPNPKFSTGAGLQTLFLLSILERCNARPVPTKDSGQAKAVFIHVGALRTLKGFPHLARRRRDDHEVSFYTYGSHISVPRHYWGVHNIFPYGGVVCLTAKCLLEFSGSVLTCLEQVAKHPLWDCYVLPEVFGAAARAVCPGADPLTTYDSGNFAFQWVLDLIERGKLMFTCSPPHERSPAVPEDDDSVHSWQMDQVRNSMKSQRELLEIASDACSRNYGRISSNTLADEKILSDIENDLLSLQMHPAVNRERRRFVVLRGSTEQQFDKERSGFEWLCPEEFSFDDDYLAD